MRMRVELSTGDASCAPEDDVGTSEWMPEHAVELTSAASAGMSCGRPATAEAPSQSTLPKSRRYLLLSLSPASLTPASARAVSAATVTR